jgi:diguanylate cyclase (GGDEF)-like protein
VSHAAAVLVLTPSIGGYWFGELLAGFTREIVGAGVRPVVVQTLDAGTRSGEVGEPGEPGDFAIPIAWSEVDAVVSIATAVGASYLQQLRDAGKPVLLVSAEMADFDAPVVLPANHGGTFAAVEHLIGHGHTRIGFVGNFSQPDVRGRYAGYLQALETHDLSADPALVFAVHNNARAGGVRAARALLGSPLRPTAVMAATDRNAFGLMRTLTDAGVAIPADIAVVGFDNIEAAAFSVPTLSSVNQRFDECGALAGRLVLAALRGEAVPYTTFTPKPGVLALRDSCGCSTEPIDTETGLSELQDILYGALLTGHDVADSPVRAAVLATVREVDRLLGKGDEVTTCEIEALTASLRGLAPRLDVLRRITFVMAEYVQHSLRTASWARGGGTAIVGPAQMTAALWQLQAGALLQHAEAAESVLDEQFVVDAGLLDISHSDPRHLGWLASTHVRAGVLALWEDDPLSGRLRVAGTYDPAGLVPDLVDTVTDPERFPPTALIAAAQTVVHGECIVVPVSTMERNWGLLALVGDIGNASIRKAYQHWAGLLCASLESERLQKEVRRNALYDALTGLPNRRLFLSRLDQAVEMWRRSKTPFAVIFLDLDGFKAINDSLGHQMGDRVLNEVGARIERELRAVDTGARFGGDEFALLLHDVEPDNAMMVASRVQKALSGVIDLNGHECAIGASLGVATSAIEYASAEDVLRDADTAMYYVKETRRGTVSFFDAAMHADAVHQLRLSAEIRSALKENQFEVHYQPIVNLATGRADRFEALVRWRHPERGLLLPEEFLPLMAEVGLIVELGHWVIDEVCRQLVAWGPGVVNVAVNISDREFWHSDLFTHVLGGLKRHNLTTDRLTLEITGAAIQRRPEEALRIMRELHDAGLQLHIDDFGTADSSLEMLHRFPVDAFKIDRSFIGGLTTGDPNAELVRAIVAMGKALGLAVVATGVETGKQLAFLREIGCTTGQGFLFMRAVTGDQVPDLLGRVLGEESQT